MPALLMPAHTKIHRISIVVRLNTITGNTITFCRFSSSMQRNRTWRQIRIFSVVALRLVDHPCHAPAMALSAPKISDPGARIPKLRRPEHGCYQRAASREAFQSGINSPVPPWTATLATVTCFRVISTTHSPCLPRRAEPTSNFGIASLTILIACS